MKYTAKITLVQLADTPDGGSTIDRMPAFFDQASAYGSDLIVYPEYVLGNRIPIDHEAVTRFRALTAEHHIYAIAGLVESHGTRWAIIGRKLTQVRSSAGTGL